MSEVQHGVISIDMRNVHQFLTSGYLYPGGSAIPFLPTVSLLRTLLEAWKTLTPFLLLGFKIESLFWWHQYFSFTTCLNLRLQKRKLKHLRHRQKRSQHQLSQRLPNLRSQIRSMSVRLRRQVNPHRTLVHPNEWDRNSRKPTRASWLRNFERYACWWDPQKRFGISIWNFYKNVWYISDWSTKHCMVLQPMPTTVVSARPMKRCNRRWQSWRKLRMLELPSHLSLHHHLRCLPQLLLQRSLVPLFIPLHRPVHRKVQHHPQPSLHQRLRVLVWLACEGFVKWSHQAVVLFPRKSMRGGKVGLKRNGRPCLKSLKKPTGQEIFGFKFKVGLLRFFLAYLEIKRLVCCFFHYICLDFLRKFKDLGINPSHIGWTQDLFVSRITKTISKTSKLSRRKKRGWFTKEGMIKTLQWSPFLGSTSATVVRVQFLIFNVKCKLWYP